MALALGLGLLALPLVIALMPALDPGTGALHADLPRADPLSGGVISASITSTLVSALVAGALWGRTAIRHPWKGGIGALATAWIVGIVLLPVSPALLGQRLIVGWACYSGCSPLVHAGNPQSGLIGATIGLPVSIAVAPGVFLTLLIGVLVWVHFLRARRDDQDEVVARLAETSAIE